MRKYKFISPARPILPNLLVASTCGLSTSRLLASKGCGRGRRRCRGVVVAVFAAVVVWLSVRFVWEVTVLQAPVPVVGVGSASTRAG